jgi:NAD(P)H-dependent FMN reductase
MHHGTRGNRNFRRVCYYVDMKILIIYGSLHKNSLNKALAQTFAKLAPDGLEVELLGIEGFPLFSEDLEAVGTPQIATNYKSKIAAADGIIVVTPEYNRSMPGALKNVIDWTSRGDHPWKGKPVGVAGASDGLRGASFAQADLKRILSYFDTHLMGQPEFYFHEADKKVANGLVTDESTRTRIVKYLEKFKTHVAIFSK